MLSAFVVVASLLSVTDHTGAVSAPDPVGRGAWLIDASEDAVLLVTPRAGIERFDGCTWPSQLAVDSTGVAYVTCRGSGDVQRLRSGEPATAWDVGAEPSSLALDEAAHRLYVGLATSSAVLMLDSDTGKELARIDTGFEPTAIGLFPAGVVVGSRKSDRLQIHARSLQGTGVSVQLKSPAVEGGVSELRVGAEQFVPESSRLIIVAPIAEVGNLDEPTYYASSRGAPVTHDLFTLDTHLNLTRIRNLVLPDVSGAHFDVRTGNVLTASRGLGSVVSTNLKSHAVGMAWDLPVGSIGIADDGQYTYVLNDATREVLLRPVTGKQLRVQHLALGGGGDSELQRGRVLFHQANNFRISGTALACASCHREGRDDGRTWLGESSMRQTPMLAGRDLAHTAPYGWNGKYARLEEYINFTITERMQGDGLGPADLKALARYVREGLRPVVQPKLERSAEAQRGRVVFHAESTGCASCHAAGDAFTDGVAHDVGSTSRRERASWLAKATLIRSITIERPEPIGLPFQSPVDPLRTLGPGGGLGSGGGGGGGEGLGTIGVAPRGLPVRKVALRRVRAPLVLPPLPWEFRRFETPSLLRVGLTAPYLHDGSAATLDDVFVRLGDHMGTVSALSSRERGDLVAYLRTL